jgi:hypothetical protein
VWHRFLSFRNRSDGGLAALQEPLFVIPTGLPLLDPDASGL